MQDCPKTPLKSDAHFTDNRSLQSPVSPFPQSPPPPPSEIDFNLLSKIDPNDPIGIVNALRMQEMALGKPDPLLPKTRPCTTESCEERANYSKRCGKCLVAFYCSRECQIADWPSHKGQCKENRRFELDKET